MAGNPIGMYGLPTVVTDGATQTWDLPNASWFQWTLGANRTMSALTGMVPGQLLFLDVIQDATGSRY